MNIFLWITQTFTKVNFPNTNLHYFVIFEPVSVSFSLKKTPSLFARGTCSCGNLLTENLVSEVVNDMIYAPKYTSLAGPCDLSQVYQRSTSLSEQTLLPKICLSHALFCWNLFNTTLDINIIMTLGFWTLCF